MIGQSNPVPRCICRVINNGGASWCPMHGYRRLEFAVVECTCLVPSYSARALFHGEGLFKAHIRIVDPWCGAHGEYVPDDYEGPFQGYTHTEDPTT